ncbi:MAG: N-acetylmuramoyl-L-alanine amidase [Planctomycetes bacterium]|nr:N-acetylmuramoyl-L-alanine amidase [Planctomycetota bacterium]
MATLAGLLALLPGRPAAAGDRDRTPPAVAAAARAPGGVVGEAGPGAPGIPLRTLADKYHLNYEEEALSGRVRLTSGGPSLIAANGMSGVLVSGRYLALTERVRVRDGEYYVPASGLPAIEAALATASRPADAPIRHRPELGEGRDPLLRVVLDPGHGGGDPGTHGQRGQVEKEINLDVSRRVRALLVAEGITVLMTRESDRALAAQQRDNLRLRAEFANAQGAELYVSIHTNANRQRSLRGFEIYYPRDEYRRERVADAAKTTSIPPAVLGTTSAPPDAVKPVLWDALYDEYYRESRELADDVRAAMKRLPTNDRGTRAAGFYVLRWSHCPAILVEMEYVSNATGEAALARSEYRQEIARAIAAGILGFKRKFDARDRNNE